MWEMSKPVKVDIARRLLIWCTLIWPTRWLLVSNSSSLKTALCCLREMNTELFHVSFYLFKKFCRSNSSNSNSKSRRRNSSKSKSRSNSSSSRSRNGHSNSSNGHSSSSSSSSSNTSLSRRHNSNSKSRSSNG